MNILFATYQTPPSQAQDSIGYLSQETDEGFYQTEAMLPSVTKDEAAMFISLFRRFGYIRLDLWKDDGTRMTVWKED